MERVLLVLAGALAIYLGYRLFLAIPAADRSEGRISLPGGVSIFLTRIGPGVFFALFGCALIGYSVGQPIDVTVPVGLAATRSADAGEAMQPSRGALPRFRRGQAPNCGRGGLEARTVLAQLNGYIEDMRQNSPAACR